MREPPPPAHIDWSEPAEEESPESYDVERDGIVSEVGPDEARVDRCLEH